MLKKNIMLCHQQQEGYGVYCLFMNKIRPMVVAMRWITKEIIVRFQIIG